MVLVIHPLSAKETGDKNILLAYSKPLRPSFLPLAVQLAKIVFLMISFSHKAVKSESEILFSVAIFLTYSGSGWAIKTA